MDNAFVWFQKELAEKEVNSYDEYIKLVPEGSESAANAQRIGSFFETAGAIAKHGLINLDLLLDRYAVMPFWQKLRFSAEHYRSLHPETGSLWAENFEWLAETNQEWADRRLRKKRKS